MSYNNGPKIVTNGLVLYLDVANNRSYPGSGTTWTDLSNRITGSLVNGPTFNSSNGGSIVFDGTNDYVSIPYSSASASLSGRTSLTFSAWVYLNSYHPADGTVFFAWPISDVAATSPFSALGLGVSTAGALNASVGNGSTRTNFFSTLTMSLNRWHNVGLLWNGSTIFTTLNGVISSTSAAASFTLGNSNTASLFLGTYNTNNVYWLNGYYSTALMHSRALSAEEIRQNYHASKGRFGL